MQHKQVHVCLEQAQAPAQDGQFVEGTRWICACGAHYVYREGFNRAGYKSMDWWEAPPIVIPEQRKPRKSLRDRLIRPRQP